MYFTKNMSTHNICYPNMYLTNLFANKISAFTSKIYLVAKLIFHKSNTM